MDFHHSCEDKKQLLDTRLDAIKTASKDVVHKAAEGTGEFIGNKVADGIAESNNDKIEKPDENPTKVEK